MLPTIFQQGIPVLKKIERAGYEAYFVGGSVRDLFLNRPINDVDIATSANPEELKEIFPKTIDLGIEHGTILVFHGGNEYEITTFRTESAYADFRRPDKVEFVRSLEADLERRDFTMNSMAMDGDGKVFDPFKGRVDIHNKVIRTVGSPELRFSEDALRMMRAVRFVSQLGFEIEQDTLHALKDHAPLLEHIAVERKTMEFEKILAAEWKREALLLLVDTGLYRDLPHLAVVKEGLEEAASLPHLETLNKDQMWLVLLTFVGSTDAQAFLKSWRIPGKMVRERSKELEILSLRRKTGWSKSLLYRAGLEAAINVERVYECLESKTSSGVEVVKQDYRSLAITSRKQLDVTGTDLMIWADQKGGPWIKECLNEIEAAVIDGRVKNEKEAIRRWLKSCNQL
ncbi:CCA tRNA nucleotidyltransferase [Bacillus sp. RO3]|nr:CCA tRNA nucleotidyltransferase [Bacillus sp. RO3]